MHNTINMNGLFYIAVIVFVIVAYPVCYFGAKRKKVLKMKASETLSREAETQFIRWRESYASGCNWAKWLFLCFPLLFIFHPFLLWTIVCFSGLVHKFDRAKGIARRLGFTSKQALNGTAVVKK